MNQLMSIVFILAYGVQSYAADVSHAKKSDEYYMEKALELAMHNPKAPFGAVIVDNKTGEILGEGFNQSSLNPTFHGEIVAINNCAEQHHRVNWSDTTLYTTAEPCPMCQSAIVWSGISKVVFATSIGYLKAHGWNQIDIDAADVNKKAPFYKGTITSGVLAEKTNPLFNRNHTPK
jgi:tRNA(Arg) A34 adenosine deaminase TadA